jgi:hypothetical protein
MVSVQRSARGTDRKIGRGAQDFFAWLSQTMPTMRASFID